MNGACGRLLTYPQHCDLSRAAQRDAKTEISQAGLGVASIEVWPAAGGGLLVGVAEPVFAGRTPSRRAIKTVFIRIDTADTITVMTPYVAMEEEARYCLRALVAAELSVIESRICFDTGRHSCSADMQIRSGLPCIVDIGPRAEHSAEACAAVARVMLVCAAAEIWELPTKLCHAVEGIIIGATGDQVLRYGEVAVQAAWRKMPGSVKLRSGRHTDLSSIPQGARDGTMLAHCSCEQELR